MKKLHKLSIKHYIGPFFITFAIAMFFLIMQFLWKYIDDMAGKGLGWYVVTELLFYASAHLVPLALPLAILLSSIMTFGSLAENHELMAFKSSGISLISIMKPMFIIMVFIAVGAFFFSNNTLPKANLKFGALLWDVKSKKPAFDLPEGIFYTGIDNFSIRVGHKNHNTGELKDVLIYDHSEGAENNIVIRAESGKMSMTDDERWLILKLYKGNRYEEIRNQKNAYRTLPHSKTRFKEYEMRFDLSSFELDRTDIDLFKGNFRMLRMDQLIYFHDSIMKKTNGLQVKVKQYLKPHLYILKDSMLAAASPQPVNFDSARFIDNIPKSKRKVVLEQASNNARTSGFLLKNLSTTYEFYLKALARYEIEWHKKIVISFVIIVLFLIGAPLGAIIRKGGLGLPSLVSILLFLLYHIMTITGEKLARKGVLEPEVGMWYPLVILLPVSIFLVNKANKDSIMFSRDGYAKLLKFFKFFSRNNP